jgi:hypothetical protein
MSIESFSYFTIASFICDPKIYLLYNHRMSIYKTNVHKVFPGKCIELMICYFIHSGIASLFYIIICKVTHYMQVFYPFPSSDLASPR